MIHGFLWDGGWGERGIIKILQSPREVSGKFCRNTTKILPFPPPPPPFRPYTNDKSPIRIHFRQR